MINDKSHSPWPEIPAGLRCDILEAGTLCEVIRHRAQCQKEKIYCTLTERKEERSITFGELYESSLQYGAAMISYGLEPGERVALMLPTGIEHLFSFFGALLVGLIPASIAPPFLPRKIKFFVKDRSESLKAIGASATITSKRLQKISQSIKDNVPAMRCVLATEELEQYFTSQDPGIEIKPHKAAMIQFSSGSSGKQKGVILTHSNLMSNIKAVHLAMGTTPEDVNVSWLPLYHDMGLIGCVCGALFAGCRLVLMSPTMFMSSPLFWLRTMHQKSGTIGVAPNFGYQLCVDRARGLDAGKIDLSAWRCALVGSEMVIEDTLVGFVEKFVPFGFRKETFMPVYGLAEATLAVCFTPPGTGPLVDRVNVRRLEIEGIAHAAYDMGESASFVSAGTPVPMVEVKIVNNSGNDVDERIQGRLLVRSPSVMGGGYSNAPGATARVLSDGWLDTGDLAYRVKDYYFITGRSDDIIIRAGRNYYPDHFEQILWNVPGIRRGCVAAFGVLSPERGTEEIIVMAEARTLEKQDKEMLVQTARRAISERLELIPDHVVIMPPKTIPRTTSGKVQRSLCRQLYVNGEVSR